MKPTKRAIGRPKKAKIGRPRVERLYIVEGDIYDRKAVDENLKAGEFSNGSVITEVLVKQKFKVITRATHLIKI